MFAWTQVWPSLVPLQITGCLHKCIAAWIKSVKVKSLQYKQSTRTVKSLQWISEVLTRVWPDQKQQLCCVGELVLWQGVCFWMSSTKRIEQQQKTTFNRADRDLLKSNSLRCDCVATILCHVKHIDFSFVLSVRHRSHLSEWRTTDPSLSVAASLQHSHWNSHQNTTRVFSWMYPSQMFV